jgi:lactate dehydrogenase-like 2-hydroxyacid dehydrogenase
MKIVFLDRSTIGGTSVDGLKRFGQLVIYDNTMASQTNERVKDQDVIITNKVYIDQKAMEAANNLKLICVAATGVNNVDLAFAKSKGIIVKNVSGYSTESVAQATFSSLLYLLHHVSYYDQYVKSGNYSKSEIFTHHARPFWQLAGKEFGIIGLGTIGKRVAEIATAFGSRISYYSTSGKNTYSAYPRHENLVSVLKNSDIISIHAPLNDQTFGLIQYEQLKFMKKNAILINMGRGGIVNEVDLSKALDDGLIAGAALDVFEKEPVGADNPLLKIKDREKLLVTPHIAWASMEARDLLMEKVCNNIEEFIKTGN